MDAWRLAEAAGVSRDYVNKMLKEPAPDGSLKKLRPVAEALGVSLAELLDPNHAATFGASNAPLTGDETAWHTAIAFTLEATLASDDLKRYSPDQIASACLKLARRISKMRQDDRLKDAAKEQATSENCGK